MSRPSCEGSAHPPNIAATSPGPPPDSPPANQRNLKLTIEYDGTDFHGWQVQPGCRTVEGTLEEALEALEGRAVDLHGASRTDRGVHALGQCASFFSESRVPTDRYARALNGRLPPDVRLTRVEEVPADFHARFSARGKCYRYLLDRREQPGVFLSRYALHAPEPLDWSAMRSASSSFLGEHDFTSYRSESGNPVESTTRTIHAVLVEEAGDVAAIEVWGSSFLYKMVRTMVGSLLEVGRGRWPASRVEESLRALDRKAAGPTAPGHALCLVSVGYDPRSFEEALRHRKEAPGSWQFRAGF